MTDLFSEIFGFSLDSPMMPYAMYRQGLYTPSEERPIIRIPGKRLWYAPWKRKPDQVFAGMSEAMAFRAQDAAIGDSPQAVDRV